MGAAEPSVLVGRIVRLLHRARDWNMLPAVKDALPWAMARTALEPIVQQFRRAQSWRDKVASARFRYEMWLTVCHYHGVEEWDSAYEVLKFFRSGGHAGARFLAKDVLPPAGEVDRHGCTDKVTVLLVSSEVLYHAKVWDEAIEHAQLLIQAKQSLGEAYYVCVMALASMGRTAAARALFDQAMKDLARLAQLEAAARIERDFTCLPLATSLSPTKAKRTLKTILFETGLSESQLHAGRLCLAYAKSSSKRGRAHGFLLYTLDGSSEGDYRSLTEVGCEVAALLIEQWRQHPAKVIVDRGQLRDVLPVARKEPTTAADKKRERDRIKQALVQVRRALESLKAARLSYRKKTDAWELLVHFTDAFVHPVQSPSA